MNISTTLILLGLFPSSYYSFKINPAAVSLSFFWGCPLEIYIVPMPTVLCILFSQEDEIRIMSRRSLQREMPLLRYPVSSTPQTRERFAHEPLQLSFFALGAISANWTSIFLITLFHLALKSYLAICLITVPRQYGPFSFLWFFSCKQCILLKCYLLLFIHY